jgi:hypothetical protein
VKERKRERAIYIYREIKKEREIERDIKKEREIER